MDSDDSIARWKKEAGAGTPENNAVIAAMLSRLDRNVGRILGVLDELDLTKNTIVVFYSDNGGLASDAAQTPLRSGKGFLYEGGIRVPLIVRWPGVVKPGKVSDDVISSYDFMPTFCELLSAKTPLNVDGVSLIPLLKNGTPLPERANYWHYPHYHSTGMKPAGAMRQGKWKFIEHYEKSLTGKSEVAYELYDLENDLAERHNLAASQKKRMLAMAGELAEWRTKVGAQMPTVNQEFKPKNPKP